MRGQHGGDLWKRTRELCLPEFKSMVAGGGEDRQFVKNIPQMTLNPWWHETQDSDSPGFSSFNYMVLCDYHKYQSIVHTCVFLCVPHCPLSTCLSLGTMPVRLLAPLTSQLPGRWNVFFVVQSFLHSQFWNWPHRNILYCFISFQKQTYIISLFTHLGQHPSMQWSK